MTDRDARTVQQTCPECGETDIRHVGYNPGHEIDGYQCRTCNHRWTEP